MKMKVSIVRAKSGINAVGEYNENTKELTVKKGSIVSSKIAYSEKFKGAATIEKHRTGVVENRVVQKDVTFKSASTAANFVTGASTNGLVAWKTENGQKLKEAIEA